MSADTIFDSETIRQIQTDELSAVSTLSIQELSQRIDTYQKVSRELYLRMGKASEELHKRLSEKNNEELDALIEKVPSAERILVSRRGFLKPKAPTVKEKTVAKAKAEARHNPLMAQLLRELSAKKD